MEKNRLQRIPELLCIDITVERWDCHHTVMTEPLMLADLAGEEIHNFKVEIAFATEMYVIRKVWISRTVAERVLNQTLKQFRLGFELGFQIGM